MHRIGEVTKIMRHVPPQRTYAQRYCSFCGDQERPLIAGPTCFICSQCVVMSVGALLDTGNKEFKDDLTRQFQRTKELYE